MFIILVCVFIISVCVLLRPSQKRRSLNYSPSLDIVMNVSRNLCWHSGRLKSTVVCNSLEIFLCVLLYGISSQSQNKCLQLFQKKMGLQHNMDLYHNSSTGLCLLVDGLFQELDFDPPCVSLPVQGILRYPSLSLLFLLE